MTGEQTPVSDGVNVSRELSFRGADSEQEEAAVPADMQTPLTPFFCTLLLLGMEHSKGPVTPEINPHSSNRSQWWSPALPQPW